MADGQEGRKEQEQRRRWEQEQTREDHLERRPPGHYDVDQYQPERRES